MLIHILLLFSLVFTSVGAPQTSKSKPDFTGTWNARIMADPNATIELLKISYSDPKLEISRTRIDPSPNDGHGTFIEHKRQPKLCLLH